MEEYVKLRKIEHELVDIHDVLNNSKDHMKNMDDVESFMKVDKSIQEIIVKLSSLNNFLATRY